jgi:hypothetical protein
MGWGGLGFKDLENFGIALRLRWLWHKWDTTERHWKHMLKSHDLVDKEFFFNSTYILIGDCKNTLFWKAKWLQRAAPKDIASILYRKARFKNRSVFTELQNCNWIKNICEINTSVLLEEYVTFFLMLSIVTLHSGHDEIVWSTVLNRRMSVNLMEP